VSTTAADMEILRPLAGRYSEIAHLDIQKERIDRYKRTVALERVRPVVLIDEVPWGEIKDDALVCRCSDPALRGIEGRMRRTLYQWDHFQVDLVVPPVFYMGKRARSTGIGMRVEDTQIKGDTGAYIAAHEYVDQLKTEEDLQKLRTPEITYDKEGTEKALERASKVFDGLMPVEARGRHMSYNLWDVIAEYRGVESLLMDLAMRPDFMHATVLRFTEIAEAQFRQYAELGLLEANSMLVHCTVACTDELPAEDFAGKVRPKDTWGRCAAQIFDSVSPEMHDEFDLVYNQRLFGDCGMVYYGCCEAVDTKVDILRKRFKNLRKISITPWADPETAARNIGGDFVMAAKPNPAFVASPKFDPKPVVEEMEKYLGACERHKTPCEFVIKDISTIGNKSENLTQWAATVKGVIDRYFE